MGTESLQVRLQTLYSECQDLVFIYMCFTGQEAGDGPAPPLEIIPEDERFLPSEAKVGGVMT